MWTFLSLRAVPGSWDPASNQLRTFSLDTLPPGALARGVGPAMAFRRTEGMSMIQALAMTVAEIPVFLYTTFGQVKTGWLVVLPFNHSGPIAVHLSSVTCLSRARGTGLGV